MVTQCMCDQASLLYCAHVLMLCAIKGKKEICPEFCSVLHNESGNVELVSLALSVAKD